MQEQGMTSLKKAKVVNEVEVSEIECKNEYVTVHGVVTELLPVKASKSSPKVKYFTGKLSVGKMPKSPQNRGLTWACANADTAYIHSFKVYTGQFDLGVEHGLAYSVVWARLQC